MSRAQIVENLYHVLESVLNKLSRKLRESVQSIHIKLSDSAALPLYAKLPVTASTPVVRKLELQLEAQISSKSKKSAPPATDEKKKKISVVKRRAV